MKKKNLGEDQLAKLIDEIKDKHGNEMILQSEEGETNVRATSTGCLGLDRVFGCGGLPEGRIIEIYGSESSGKTTMTLFIAAQMQKHGKRIAFCDVEQAFDRKWAEKLGVDVSQMLVMQPSTIEETMEVVRSITASNIFDMIIIDSVEAMIPAKELEEGALEKDSIGLRARLLNKYLRVLTAEAARTKTSIVFINQVRANVGVLYGQKEITPGGKALKFYASVRLAVSKGQAIKRGIEQIGNTVKVVAKKNKVGFPYREVELDLEYQSGIDLFKDTLDSAERYGVIKKEKRTYLYENQKIGASKEEAANYLRDNPDIYERVFSQVTQIISSGSGGDEPLSDDEG